MKTKNIFKLGAAAATAYAAIGSVFYAGVLTRPGYQIASRFMKDASKDMDDVCRKSEETTAATKWYDSVEKEKIYTFTREGKRCHGVYIKNEKPSNLYFVSCHGYSAAPGAQCAYAKHFYDKGYNILLPVLNGHSDSETLFITMGWNDRLIVTAFTEYFAIRNPQAQIVIHGVSMGSATVMNATGERMPENVKCCIADCGYTTCWDVYAVQIRQLLHLTSFPFLPAANSVSKLVTGFDFKKCAPLNQVKKSVTPTLFIHGDRDVVVPFWMQETLYEAAVCEKEKLVVPEAMHYVSVYVDPALYWNTVDTFVAKYVNE